MSGDLEDFLRRAAARRQQKATQEKQQAQQQQQQREPPQYTDSRTERVARDVEPVDEPVLVADVIEDSTNSYAAQLQRIEDTKRAAAQAQREAKRTSDQAADRASKKSGRSSVIAATGSPAIDLINMLKRPGGVQQAILLREIFDRPEHRW